jgi:glucan phosphorylase
MKVLIHGGLNLSIMDGWWREACDGTNGWAIGNDRSQADVEAQDEQDFQDLLAVLTKEVIPEFYNRDAHGLPRAWLRRMRNSMRTLIPAFSTDRMVAEYVDKYYGV